MLFLCLCECACVCARSASSMFTRSRLSSEKQISTILFTQYDRYLWVGDKNVQILSLIPVNVGMNVASLLNLNWTAIHQK